MSSEHHLQKLFEQLKSPDSSIRNAAVIELGVMQNIDAVIPMMKLLQDPNETVRLFSVRALRNILRAHKDLDDIVGDALIACLQDTYEPVQRAAAFTLSDLRYTRAEAALVKLFPVASPTLSLDLLYVLVEIGGLDALSPVMNLLDDKPSNVRGAVQRALQEIGYNPATK